MDKGKRQIYPRLSIIIGNNISQAAVVRGIVEINPMLTVISSNNICQAIVC